jgi:hypothetical protein
MSVPEPLIEITPPAVLLALPLNPTEPMSVSVQGDGNPAADTCGDIHTNLEHIANTRTAQSKYAVRKIHTFIG